MSVEEARAELLLRISEYDSCCGRWFGPAEDELGRERGTNWEDFERYVNVAVDRLIQEVRAETAPPS